MGEGIKTVFAMIRAHAAFAESAESHFAGSQVDDGIIDTASTESTAGSDFFRYVRIICENV